MQNKHEQVTGLDISLPQYVRCLASKELCNTFPAESQGTAVPFGFPQATET